MELKLAPKISVALSSGGARGFAHVGVLKVLVEAGLDVANVVGTSMGGVVAAGYAVRGDVAELERWVLGFRSRDHSRPGRPYMDLDRLTSFFETLFDNARIGDCLVPLTLIATDLKRRTTTALSEGPLAAALSATTALPFLHRPVPWQGALLADGALTCVLPTREAVRPGTDLVIGSYASRDASRAESLLLLAAQRAGRAVHGWRRAYVDFFRTVLASADPESDAGPPTLIVSPDLTDIGVFDFHKSREAIAAGERAAREKLGEILTLLGQVQPRSAGHLA